MARKLLGTAPASADDAARLGDVSGGGGSGPLLGMVPKVGQFLIPTLVTTSWATSTDALPFGSSAAATPMVVRKQITIDALSCNIATNEAGIGVRVALYSSDSDGHPATLVATGTASAAGTGALVIVLGSPVVLPAGLYWAIVRSDAGSTLRFSAQAGGGINWLGGSVSPTGGAPSRNTAPGITMGGTFAAPNTTPTVGYGAVSANDAPFVGLRRSA